MKLNRQKSVAAIHDVSGVGRCSLTVALPILSAAGFVTSVMPTAVLSTHTGGFSGYTYRDLTDDLLPMARHWKSLNLRFDALYSGFLGSARQLDYVNEVFRMFRTDDNLVLVDPVMADHGRLYSSFQQDFTAGMAKLCRSADIIVPNMTEALFLLGREYREGPYEKSLIETLLRSLAKLGPQKIVLTGVWFEPARLGAACYDAVSGRMEYHMAERMDGIFHGTGDIFASVLLAGLLREKSLSEATRLAVDFTAGAIRRTAVKPCDLRYGVNFEEEIPSLLKRLGLC